jgi:hypothetical protein
MDKIYHALFFIAIASPCGFARINSTGGSECQKIVAPEI